MFSKSKDLTKLINNEIDKLNSNIDKYKESNNKLVELYNDINSNKEKLVYLSKEEIKSLIDKFNIEDKDNLYKEILDIKKLLTMNKDYKSTLRLSNKNKDSFNIFMNSFNEFNKYLESNDPNILILQDKILDYNRLIDNISKDNYKVTSNDLKLLIEVFKNNNTNDSRKVLIELINYDKDNYNNELSKSRKKNIVINEDDLINVFTEYGYNFNDLDLEYKDYLKMNGNINNIREVFDALKDNDYPIINNGYVLTSLLLGSNKKTINDITSFAKKNKLIPKSLLDISGALIEQTEVEDDSSLSIMLTGSSIDFMRNITTLKSAGISINYIFQSCKSILTMPNELLESNLDNFQKYGFSFEYKRKGIIDPSPCSLLSLNFAAITDAFIEVSPNGLKYLTDNLSNLKTVSNPKNLMFYNIYECEKENKDNIEEGPFRKVLEDNDDNYQLKAMITRNRPDFRNTYYKGINEDNKYKITNTVTIELNNKHFLDKIIEDNKYTPISTNIFNNSFIKATNKYIDEDSPLIYNFDRVRISRLKVLRIFDILLNNSAKNSIENFMYSITYNSILDEESYNVIFRCIKKELERQ